ncbi:MAG: transposase [Phycisphaerae bacterium]|nr:transposase [Phycisphaerae bacterium]
MKIDRTRQWTIEAVEFARGKHGFHLWAYVIMPEHVHLLIYPQTPEYRIRSILTSLKQPLAKRAINYMRMYEPSFLERLSDRQPNGRTSIRFWQRGGGYDRNLWSQRLVWETID